MRRALVLGDESARHPFRQVLPPHVRGGKASHPFRAEPRASLIEAVGRSVLGWLRDAVGRLRGRIAPGGRAWRISMQDARDFLLAYCACFLAVSAFIW